MQLGIDGLCFERSPCCSTEMVIPIRAPGTAPGLFALDSAINETAVKLGIDPLEFRAPCTS